LSDFAVANLDGESQGGADQFNHAKEFVTVTLHRVHRKRKNEIFPGLPAPRPDEFDASVAYALCVRRADNYDHP
jgi:hypothetical protein